MYKCIVHMRPRRGQTTDVFCVSAFFLFLQVSSFFFFFNVSIMGDVCVHWRAWHLQYMNTDLHTRLFFSVGTFVCIISGKDSQVKS